MAKVLIIKENNNKGKKGLEYIVKNSIISIYDLYSIIYDIDIKDKDYKLYAITDESGRFKIGISSDPERRVRELNIGNAEKLTLIHVMDAKLPNFQSETSAHNKLDDKRIRGEWFTPNSKPKIEQIFK